MLIHLAVFLITFLIALIGYYKRCFSYWDRKCVPSPKPTIPFGNMENPFSRKHSLGVLMKIYYNQFKSKGYKHVGLYNFSSPVYLPIDSEYIKLIMQKDFEHFVDRGFYYNERDDPLSAHLFAIGGQKWRKLRTKLTPTFTSGKMKMMFSTLMQCSVQLKQAMDDLCGEHKPIEIKDIVTRFTMDIIGSCAFGLECNSFKESEPEFTKYGKRAIAVFSKLTGFLQIFATAQPEIGRFLKISLLPKEATNFYYNVVRDTVDYRKRNNFIRNDMLQILIDLQKEEEAKNSQSLTLEEIAAQCFIFFIAGFETSSTTMNFCLFELAINVGIQEKVRKEICEVLEKHQGEVTYDSLAEMKYLTQVIEETMRKYPPLGHLNRRCVKNYTIPNTNIVIEKGTLVFLPVLGLHHDPEYFPNPEKFDPERFAPENKQRIPPFTYMPFGEGPRLCIGLRFGWMQTKIGLITLLRNYQFTLNKKTKIPIEIEPYSTSILTAKNCIWLNAEKVL